MGRVSAAQYRGRVAGWCVVTALYNENDPFAAQWLRNLISMGALPPGDVDERSIVDIRPADVAGYEQVHFFAGIGGWGHALRLARWPDDRPIWTGSCPCQPFSVAGKGAGSDDARHLWPYFMDLIASVRPPVVMGEQVAGQAGYGWLDGVRSDLAGQGYASRGVDIPACAVDAPHIRQRLYWVAVADDIGGRSHLQRSSQGAGQDRHESAGQIAGSHGGYLADADRGGRSGRAEDSERGAGGRAAAERADDLGDASGERRGEGRAEHELRSGRPTVASADARGRRLRGQWGRHIDVEVSERGGREGRDEARIGSGSALSSGLGRNETARSFWSDADRLLCHDGKTRRTQPGIPLLVDGIRGRVALGVSLGETDHGLPDDSLGHMINRVGAWKGFGNAIVPQEAEQVVRAFMDVHP